MNSRWMLTRVCLEYFDLYEAGLFDESIRACRIYGRIAGMRVAFNRIPHAGYWFED